MADAENWYILEIDDVEEAVGKLIRGGIPCQNVSKQYQNKEAMAFPSSSLNRVMEILNRENQSYLLEPTNAGNTFIIKFQDVTAEYAIEPTYNFEGWAFMLPVMEGVFDTFGVRVLPTNPHGEPVNPTPVSNDNFLYVHFWSTPAKTKAITLSEVCGITLTKDQSDAFKPSKIGDTIRDEKGTAIAEYLNDNLYILFDLPHAEGEIVTELFTRIMSKYFAFRGKTERDLKIFYNKVRGKQGLNSRDEFLAACCKLYEKSLKDMEGTIKEFDKRIDEKNKSLVADIRDREILLMKYDPLRSSVESRRTWADQEYSALLASPHVKDVVVIGKTIQIFTDMIRITHHMVTYEMGEFRIDIHTDGSDQNVKIYNLTKPIQGKLAHPHIKISGECCFGNIQSGVQKLLTEYQYVVLAQLMVTYLQSYNPESPYGKIELWKNR